MSIGDHCVAISERLVGSTDDGRLDNGSLVPASCQNIFSPEPAESDSSGRAGDHRNGDANRNDAKPAGFGHSCNLEVVDQQSQPDERAAEAEDMVELNEVAQERDELGGCVERRNEHLHQRYGRVSQSVDPDSSGQRSHEADCGAKPRDVADRIVDAVVLLGVGAEARPLSQVLDGRHPHGKHLPEPVPLHTSDW